MIEKLEGCPVCGEVKKWLYDAQLCASCGYGDRFRAAVVARDAGCSCDIRRALEDIIAQIESDPYTTPDLTRALAALGQGST